MGVEDIRVACFGAKRSPKGFTIDFGQQVEVAFLPQGQKHAGGKPRHHGQSPHLRDFGLARLVHVPAHKTCPPEVRDEEGDQKP